MTNLADNKQISVGTRLGAMILDHFFMTIIAMVFFIPGMISGFSHAFNVSHEPSNPDIMGGSLDYASLFGFALYFCKDIVNGRSLAKRALKLQVVDNTTGEPASPIKCFIRDIFCIVWPIEVIVALTNTSRRLGDRIAGTKLVVFDPSLEQPKPGIGRLLVPVILSYGLLLLLKPIFPSMRTASTIYSETSYNPAESRELEKLLTDSLGQFGTADIRVYDTVKNEQLKYVSLILKLKANYIENENSYMKLNQSATDLVYSRFPKETITGEAKYVYQATLQFHSRSNPIGRYPKQRNEK